MRHIETPKKLAICNALYTRTMIDGGCSLNFNTMEEPTAGVVVELD